MKTKIWMIVLSAVLLVGNTACTKWLDLHPENEIIVDEYWTTESEVEAVLMACYRAFITDDCTYRMLAWGELRSDNFTEGMNVSDGIRRILAQEVTETTSYTSWGGFYTVINYCNTLLHYAPNVLEEDANFTVGKLRSLSAEAYTLRALAYFYLVRAFQNVPWITDPSLDDTQDYAIPQSEERAILDSIIYDLETRALPYARESFETKTLTKGRITKNAVYALLADIYLWDGQYEKCISACNEIMKDEDLELVDADNFFYQVFYQGFSTESIFEFGYDDDVQINNATRTLYGYQSDRNGELSFPSNLVTGEYSPFNFTIGTNTESDGDIDIRYKDFFNNSASAGFYFIFKYAGLMRTENATGTISSYSYRSNTSNWIVYRLTDIALMKAEALIQSRQEAGMEEAVIMTNFSYKRANPTGDSLLVTNYSTYGQVAELVLRERQRELMFEGKRWFDLMRLARREGSPNPLVSYISRVTSGSEALGKMSSMNALYWPVNKSELEANPALVQNPFYESKLTSNTAN